MRTEFGNEEVIGDLDKSGFQRGFKKVFKTFLVRFQKRTEGKEVQTVECQHDFVDFYLTGNIKIG